MLVTKGILAIFLLSVHTVVFSISSKKPSNIPSYASWNFKLKIWEYKDQRTGSYQSWHGNGKVRNKFIQNKRRSKVREKFYTKSGQLKVLGQSYFEKRKTTRPRSDGKLYTYSIGYRSYGRWREYFETGKVKSDYCLTLVFEEEESLKCHKEIHYPPNGSIIRH